MTTEAVIDVGEADFEARVLEASASVPVVVDFWADWCQPCRVLSPLLERLAAEQRGRFVLAKVDVDANPGLAAAFRIQSIPSVKAFRDGVVVSEFVGVQPEEALRRWVAALLPSQAEPLVAEARTALAAGEAERAERLFRRAIEEDPEHPEAGAGLGRALLAAGREEEARDAVAGLPPTPEVRAVRSEIELRAAARQAGDLEALRARAAAGDADAALVLAGAEAAAGDHRAALERALGVVEAGGEARDRARELMVRVFEALGNDHPLTVEFRPRLASALF